MIELLFTACLAMAPETCRERTLLFSDISLGVCTAQSQPILAKWVSDHPGWRITGWTCRPHQTGQADI